MSKPLYTFIPKALEQIIEIAPDRFQHKDMDKVNILCYTAIGKAIEHYYDVRIPGMNTQINFDTSIGSRIKEELQKDHEIPYKLALIEQTRNQEYITNIVQSLCNYVSDQLKGIPQMIVQQKLQATANEIFTKYQLALTYTTIDSTHEPIVEMKKGFRIANGNYWVHPSTKNKKTFQSKHGLANLATIISPMSEYK